MVLKICNAEGNEHTGFEISKFENLKNIFPEGIHRGQEFSISDYNFEIVDVFIESFSKTIRPTLDDQEGSEMDAHIFVACKCDNANFNEWNYEFQDLKEYFSRT